MAFNPTFQNFADIETASRRSQRPTRPAPDTLPGTGAKNSDASTVRSDNGSDADDEEDSDYVLEDRAEADDVEDDFSFDQGDAPNPSTPANPSVSMGQTPSEPSTIRAAGGRAAVTKKVTTSLDSDDEIIKKMKEAGHKDKDVRQRLIEDGRTKYAEKSISTRYARICRVFKAKETEDLDDDLTEWHEGDDEVLDRARAKHQAELDNNIEHLTRKFWTGVADEVHQEQRRLGQNKARFSRNACRARQAARDAGTAEPVVELDPDQAGRAAKRVAVLADVAARKTHRQTERETKERERRAREQEAAARGDALLRKHLTREQMRELRSKQREEKQSAVRARKAVELEARNIRNAERARKKEEREESLALKRLNKRQVQWQQEDRRRAAATEREERRRRGEVAELQRQIEATQAKFEAERDQREIEDLVRKTLREALDEDKAANERAPKTRVGANTVKTSREELLAQARTMMTTKEATQGDQQSSTPDKGKEGGLPTDPMLHPRWSMKMGELRRLCKMRKVETGAGEDRRGLVLRLMQADQKLTHKEAQGMLKERGVAMYGTKTTVLLRLANDDAGNLAKGSDMHDRLKQKPTTGLFVEREECAEAGEIVKDRA